MVCGWPSSVVAKSFSRPSIGLPASRGARRARSFQEIEVAFRASEPRRRCSVLEEGTEPLSGKWTVRTGNFRESDGHDVVDQKHGGVEVRRIGWTKIGSPAPILPTIRPEPEPVHALPHLLRWRRLGRHGSPAASVSARAVASSDVRSRHRLTEDFRNRCGKVCGKRLSFTRSSHTIPNVLAVCTVIGHSRGPRTKE
jgi:hypothetical protein